MKKILIILCFIISSIANSQNKNFRVQELQLETYKYTISNLEKISKNIEDKNSLIEVTIEFENKSIKQIKYNLILPENNYSGENKTEIKVWKGLNKSIHNLVNNGINNCSNFNSVKLVFRIPISIENIKKAIEEVNKDIINTEKNEE
jgi:hypothetical protein